MIPRVLHQIWCGDNVPSEIIKRMEGVKRMNPDFQYRLHRDPAEFKNDPYLDWAKSANQPTAFFVDRMRLLCLRNEGGIYVDADCQAVRPLVNLGIFDDTRADFMLGLRSPDRLGVQLRNGVSLADNTVLASAKNGRMIARLLELYHPAGKVQNGSSVGIHALRHLGPDTRVLGFKYFYAEQSYPETILLHDACNLGSWMTPKNGPAKV